MPTQPPPEPGPGLAPSPGSLGPGDRPQPRPPLAHLARLVELLLQPRHRHAASRRRVSSPEPANRRNRASDRLPGTADPARASAGPVGAASAALSPAPRLRRRRLSSPRARATRILHGNRTLPVSALTVHARPLPAGERTHTSLTVRGTSPASEWTGASLEGPWRLQRPPRTRR